MADNALLKKLCLMPEQRAAILRAPVGYLDTLRPLPDGVELVERLDGVFDWIQLFVKNRAEVESLAPHTITALKPISLLWIAFPKGSSKLQTDLTRDVGWETLRGSNLRWLSLISVDDTWSAFSLRPYKPGEARQTIRQ